MRTKQNQIPNPQNADSPKRRCQFCGQEAELIWVHGHGQCAACGINAEECCSGETCSK